MFLFRWLKRVVVLVLSVAGFIYIANYSWHGKPIRQHVAEAYKSGLITEGIADMKTWLGDFFRVGRIIGDNLTNRDREALEQVLTSELKTNVQKLKEESEKAAEPKK